MIKKLILNLKKITQLLLFYTTRNSKLSWAKSNSTKAFKGSKFGNMYLNKSLKCEKLKITRKNISPLFKKLNKDYEKAYSKCTTSKQKMSLGKKYRNNIKASIKKFKKTLKK